MKPMSDDVKRFDDAFSKFVNDVVTESGFPDVTVGEAVQRLKEVSL
jgi:hypothetical protein